MYAAVCVASRARSNLKRPGTSTPRCKTTPLSLVLLFVLLWLVLSIVVLLLYKYYYISLNTTTYWYGQRTHTTRYFIRRSADERNGVQHICIYIYIYIYIECIIHVYVYNIYIYIYIHIPNNCLYGMSNRGRLGIDLLPST